MRTIPIVEIHIERLSKEVTFIFLALHPKLGLSVYVGDFKVMKWEEFRARGFLETQQALRCYHTGYKAEKPFYDTLTNNDLRDFHRRHFSYLISERGDDLWWIDPMEIIDKGESVLPFGPKKRVLFHPSFGETAFASSFLDFPSEASG